MNGPSELECHIPVGSKANQGQSLSLSGLINKSQRQINVVNLTSGTIFTIDFLHDFQIGPMSQCSITLGWEGLHTTDKHSNLLG